MRRARRGGRPLLPSLLPSPPPPVHAPCPRELAAWSGSDLPAPSGCVQGTRTLRWRRRPCGRSRRGRHACNSCSWRGRLPRSCFSAWSHTLQPTSSRPSASAACPRGPWGSPGRAGKASSCCSSSSSSALLSPSGCAPLPPPTPVPPFPPPPSQPPVLPSLGRSRSPWVPPPMLQALIVAPPAAAPERGVRLRCPDRGLRPARPGGGRLPGLAHGPRRACLCPRAPARRGGAGLLRGGAPGRRGVPCIAAPRAAHHETGVGRGSAHSICTYIAASAMALIVIQRVGKILAERRRVGGAPRLTPSGAAARRWARAASTPSSGARCCRPGGGSAPRPGRRRPPPPPSRGAGAPPGGSPATRGRSGCPRSR